ncbi:MAG: heme exporter protein CcmB [Candidatus Latescibacterota bacterium]|nr:heme exporter protein CcmB [Candidatus Latescibacterota bacterium]
MIWWQHIATLLRKDLRLEWRSKERLSPMVFFVLLVLLVFNFGFELGGAALGEIGPGVLWSAVLFASLIGLQRTFTAEDADDCLDGILASPVSRSSLYVAKMAGNFLFLLAVELITLPLFGLFFNLTVGAYLAPLLIVFALGSTCIASVGTLFAAMAGHSRLREFFLPLLSLPILIPALISCVEATSLILAAGVPGHTTLWPDGLGTHLAMLAASGVICFFLALLLFDFVMEE